MTPCAPPLALDGVKSALAVFRLPRYNRDVETSRHRSYVILVLLVLALLCAPAPAAADALPDAIRAVLGSSRLDGLRAPDFSRERYLVDPVYAESGYDPVWLDRHDEPSSAARDAITDLREVAVHGLDPGDYDSGALAEWGAQLGHGRHSAVELARFDVALTVAAVRLVSDLHVGRIDPEAFGFHYDLASKRAELPALVGDAVTRGRLHDAIAAAVPQFGEYHLLQQRLAQYRAIAADGSVGPVALPSPIRPHDRLPAASRLAHWLVALGDLEPETKVGRTYDGALVAAVQRFQARHGLGPDGVIGEGTARALAVSADVRARTIELALERLRWLPPLPPERALVVDVPAFELWVLDELGSGRPPVMQMSVVVGTADRTQTPFFVATLRAIVFAPYWRVPPSIIRKEIVPKLRAEPGYLAAQGMEIVSDGTVIPATGDAIARLDHGVVSLRQRPGPLNALGRVKFLFPNPYDVYMHDTPSRRLFKKSRRDFSHGCIRLSDASALAHWVLEGEGWDPARVDGMLAVEHEKSVPLKSTIPVLIGYATAVARADGTIAFYEDIYGHDAELEHALATRSTPPPAVTASGE